ncbi:glycoside hydrolase family 10 protein [Tautonia rosea]|uniref:hypothetical protein n=1 Tax=Tautonia rosea TaxID=2728037 RepID=UPI0014734F60|nr:hypothetical protein [Tautonia rosea]
MSRVTCQMMIPCLAVLVCLGADDPRELSERPITVRGIYGGVPRQILERGETLADYGINAIWIGSGGLRSEDIATMREQGVRVFAEFNTMHVASFLTEHPDATPIGPDGRPSPPPEGWQGVCPTHPGYRSDRMDEFRRVLRDFEIDGIWLDYHHAHASWERDKPLLPETCFCDRCLTQFQRETGLDLPDVPTAGRAALLLGPMKEHWVQWRCDVFTDWVRAFRAIRDETRPEALLGTFHCPWSDSDYNNAIRNSLAIDLKAQAPLFDVLSPMPYHARFGHADDRAWISRQTAWLGEFLGISGAPNDRIVIWPIVQLSDWGASVSPEDVTDVLDHGTRGPSTGVMVFAWSGLQQDWDKVKKLGEFYRKLARNSSGAD